MFKRKLDCDKLDDGSVRWRFWKKPRKDAESRYTRTDGEGSTSSHTTQMETEDVLEKQTNKELGNVSVTTESFTLRSMLECEGANFMCNTQSPTSPINEVAASPRSREDFGEGSQDLQGDSTPRKKNASLRKYLQKHFVDLKSDLEPDELVDVLYQEEVLSEAERRTIQEAQYHGEKSENLILYIVRFSKTAKADDGTLAQILKDAFIKIGSSHLAHKMDAELEDTSGDKDTEIKSLFEDCAWKQKLDAFLRLNGDEINPTHILDRLLSKEVIHFDEYENIKKIGFYPEKFSSLVEYLKRKTVQEYKTFVDIIAEEYPEHIGGFDDENIMDTHKVVQITPLEMTQLHISDIMPNYNVNDGVLTLKCEGNAKEIEIKTIDRHKSTMNCDLHNKFVELAAMEIQNLKLGSIIITFKALSRRSQMQVFQHCKDSPQHLLSLLRSVYNEDDFRQLTEKGISKLHVTFDVLWEDCPVTKGGIARNFSQLKRNMPDILDIMSDCEETDLVFVKTKSTKLERNATYLVQLVCGTQDQLVTFYRTLKKKKFEKILKIFEEDQIDRNVRCCALSKDLLHENLALLATRLTCLKQILKSFEKYPRFDKTDRMDFTSLLKELEQCKGEKTSATIIEAFLQKVLDMRYGHLEVCLLEEEMRKTKQDDLLRCIFNAENAQKTLYDSSHFELQREDVVRNESILLNELEPKQFKCIFEEDDQRKESIMTTTKRRERCNAFLEELRNDPEILTEFAEVLKKDCFMKISQILLDGRKQGKAEEELTNEDIRRNMNFLTEEIEAHNFLTIFHDLPNTIHYNAVEKKILFESQRRLRNTLFLEFLLSRPATDKSVLKLFQRRLVELCIPEILGFLICSRDADPRQEKMRDAVCTLYSSIVEEVETKRLRPVFVERGVIDSDEFDSFCKTTRREGITRLLKFVLSGKPSRAHCLVNALEMAGYFQLVKKIEVEMEKDQSCPRLCKLQLCKEDGFTVDGELKLNAPQGVDGILGKDVGGVSKGNSSSDKSTSMPSPNTLISRRDFKEVFKRAQC